MKSNRMLCISHDSALFYWRTNPPQYVLEGGDRNIRSLRYTPRTKEQFNSFFLAEAEFGPDPIDVLLTKNTPYTPERFRAHFQCKQLPPHSLYPLHDGIHIVSPELCLVQLCHSLPFVEALQLGMELCGIYAVREDTDEGMAKRTYCLVDANAFRRHVNAWKDYKGIGQARKVAQYLESGSGSPMETKLYLLLCLPVKYGGYGLPRPELNPEIPLSEKDARLLRKNNVHPDFLWRGAGGNAGWVVEYGGKYHEYGYQPVKDEMRRTVLESMGYTVMEVKYEQMKGWAACDSIANTLARALGWRMRPLTLGQEYKRQELRRKLGL